MNTAEEIARLSLTEVIQRERQNAARIVREYKAVLPPEYELHVFAPELSSHGRDKLNRILHMTREALAAAILAAAIPPPATPEAGPPPK